MYLHPLYVPHVIPYFTSSFSVSQHPGAGVSDDVTTGMGLSPVEQVTEPHRPACLLHL